MDTNVEMKVPFYSSWVALIVFIFILISQPREATFYAFRPSDVWLLFCLLLQIKNGLNIILPFSNRSLIRNYGFFFGVLAIIATLIQASYADISLKISFLFQFFRFLRFLLIFKFAENILTNFSINDAKKFWKAYFLMGIVILILSFLEYIDYKAVKLVMLNLYYERPADTIQDYLIKAERLTGVMGNSNNLSILFVTTLIYPLLGIGSEESPIFKKILYSIYVLVTLYVLLVMTGSRSSIFILVIIFSIILFATSRRLKQALQYVLIVLILMTTSLFFYQHFESKIIVQDRIIEKVHGENFQLSPKGIGKWVDRYDDWQEYLRTFKSKGSPLANLIGLGYTKAYVDYADNGFISTFINNGLIGLILKLLIFYIFFKAGFLKAIQYYIHSRIDYLNLAFALCAISLLLLELTIDVLDDYKLGQLFFLFISITMIVNAKIILLENK